MNDLSRREFLEAGVPASLAALVALHPALPTDPAGGEEEIRIAARWLAGSQEGVHVLAVGPTPLPGCTAHGSIEGVLFAYQPGRHQWYFRVGSAVTNFEACDLPAAKKHAEQHMVELVRACLVAMEKSAFALRAR